MKRLRDRWPENWVPPTIPLLVLIAAGLWIMVWVWS